MRANQLKMLARKQQKKLVHDFKSKRREYGINAVLPYAVSGEEKIMQGEGGSWMINHKTGAVHIAPGCSKKNVKAFNDYFTNTFMKAQGYSWFKECDSDHIKLLGNNRSNHAVDIACFLKDKDGQIRFLSIVREDTKQYAGIGGMIFPKDVERIKESKGECLDLRPIKKLIREVLEEGCSKDLCLPGSASEEVVNMLTSDELKGAFKKAIREGYGGEFKSDESDKRIINDYLDRHLTNGSDNATVLQSIIAGLNEFFKELTKTEERVEVLATSLKVETYLATSVGKSFERAFIDKFKFFNIDRRVETDPRGTDAAWMVSHVATGVVDEQFFARCKLSLNGGSDAEKESAQFRIVDRNLLQNLYADHSAMLLESLAHNLTIGALMESDVGFVVAEASVLHGHVLKEERTYHQGSPVSRQGLFGNSASYQTFDSDWKENKESSSCCQKSCVII